jgi:hypothetical protein
MATESNSGIGGARSGPVEVQAAERSSSEMISMKFGRLHAPGGLGLARAITSMTKLCGIMNQV